MEIDLLPKIRTGFLIRIAHIIVGCEAVPEPSGPVGSKRTEILYSIDRMGDMDMFG
jgi:hypothetical protein